MKHYPFVIIMDTATDERIRGRTVYRIGEFLRHDELDYRIFAIHPEVYRDKETAQREIRNWLYIQDKMNEAMQ